LKNCVFKNRPSIKTESGVLKSDSELKSVAFDMEWWLTTFQRQFPDKLEKLKDIIIESLATFKVKHENVPVSVIVKKCLDVWYEREILGESE